MKTISHQLNSSSSISIPRHVGPRNCNYRLIAFTDESKTIYGTVSYIQCIATKKVTFLVAKNRLVGKSLEDETIPSLAFFAIVLCTETLIGIKNRLSGEKH